MSEWQPIETAPKEYTKEMFVVIAIGANGGKYNTDPYCVWYDDGDFIRWPHSFKPTHWMPLPPVATS
jgi:hypothetical protein